MKEPIRYLCPDEAADAVRALAARTEATEFVSVPNLEYVGSPYEVYPLAPHVHPPLERIVALAVDMDGTSTTTEPLALHALEYMVRRFTGLPTKEEWSGLNPVEDYPHVIGNSNYRHAEFLLARYRDRLRPDAVRQAFIEALCWTVSSMPDEQRRRDVARNARNCGLGALLEDAAFRWLCRDGAMDLETAARKAAPFLAKFGGAMEVDGAAQLVPALLDIYYMRYHSIMQLIEQGRGSTLAAELLGDSSRLLIEPMAGYDVFVALVKGWLGADAGQLTELLPGGAGHASRLSSLGVRFQRRPAKLALVTASIAYEAHTTMREVFRVMAERAKRWPVSQACRERVLQGLADYHAAFDAFVNASDACEHRLKPHRDLYSIALSRMALPPAEYRYCVGLEDTEPGIISLRAAGIGCAVALPNHDTSRQDYRAATLTVHGGLPELMLQRNLLLEEGAS